MPQVFPGRYTNDAQGEVTVFLIGMRFNQWWRYVKSLGDHPAVGIWHETYVSAPGTRESIYVNMPEFGLAGATEHVPVGHGKRTAKQRMGRKPEAS